MTAGAAASSPGTGSALGEGRVRGVVTAGAIALGGAAACAAVGGVPSATPGAARLGAPDVVLAAFDLAVLIAVAWPRGGSGGGRGLAAVLACAAALPFHLALSAAAGAGPGHGIAVAMLIGTAALVAATAARWPGYATLLGVVWLALPLVLYVADDFAAAGTLRGALVSPALALVVCAHTAATVTPADALPGVCGALAVGLIAAASTRLLGRNRRGLDAPTSPLWLLVLVPSVALWTVAGSATAGDPTAAFDGVVRDGRPLGVVVPGALRVRARTSPDTRAGPWSLGGGPRGDEFILPAQIVSGDTLRLDVDRGGGRIEAVEIPVRVLPADGERPARLAGPVARAEVAVRAVDLPTQRDAWLVFDGVVGGGGAVVGLEGDAVESARDGPRRAPFEPLLLAPSPLPFRATAETAGRTRRLPQDVVRVLWILGAALVVAAALLRWTRHGRTRVVAALALPPLLATAWLLGAERLPGDVRVTVDIVDGASDRLVLVRLRSEVGGIVALETPAGAGVVAGLRWSAEDPGPDADLGPGRATVRLGAGRTAVLAYRLPLDATSASAAAGRDPGPAGRDGRTPPGLRPLAAWLRAAELRVNAAGDAPLEALPHVRGAPALPGRRFVVAERF